MKKLPVIASLIAISLLVGYSQDKPKDKKKPETLSVSVDSLNKRIGEFTAQRNQLKNWIETTEKQLADAKKQLEQADVVINTLNAVKTDTTIRAKK